MTFHLMHTQKGTAKLGVIVSVCRQIEARSQYQLPNFNHHCFALLSAQVSLHVSSWPCMFCDIPSKLISGLS